MKNVKKLLALVLALVLTVVMTGLISAGAVTLSGSVSSGNAQTPSQPTPSQPTPTKKPTTSQAPSQTPSQPDKHVNEKDVIIPQATKAPAAATKPAGNAGGNKAPAAPAAPAAPVEAVPQLNASAARILAAMGLTADPSAMTVTADGIVIALDTPYGTYGGSKLTSYFDDATYALASTYSAEEIASFDAWRKSADALTSGKFAEFTKFANAELTALLPAMSADEVTNVLSAILASSAEGVVITAENAPAFWTPDTTVLGVETMEGYVFYLMIQGNDVVLGFTEV